MEGVLHPLSDAYRESTITAQPDLVQYFGEDEFDAATADNSDETFSNDSVSAVTASPDDDDARFVIPMRVILPVEHVHDNRDTNNASLIKYSYIVLRTDNQSYHGHLSTDLGETLSDNRDENEVVMATNATSEYDGRGDRVIDKDSTGQRPLLLFNNSISRNFMPKGGGVAAPAAADSHVKSTTATQSIDQRLLLNRARDQFKRVKSYPDQGFDELEPVFNRVDSFVTDDSTDGDQVMVLDHYVNLFPWLDFLL